MPQKTAVGGFDFGDDWSKLIVLLAFLAAVGILPRNWKAMLGTVGGLAAIYKILKDLGWI